MYFRLFSIAIMTLLFGHHVASADVTQRTMKVDNDHVNSWNRFAKQALELHRQQIKDRKVKKKVSYGGYHRHPKYYKQETFFDKKTGKKLSVVQWETKNPSNLHSIEVFVYDDNGKLVRDYSAAYLPEMRNAPVQTLINFHTYNGNLHAFRQFDGTEDVIYEFCKGKFNGKKRQIRLFEDDLAATDYDSRQLIKSPLYQACFAGLPQTPGKYIKPQ